MKINYNVTGTQRKSLVNAISQELNSPVKYLGMPTAAYEVGGYHIDKTGTVTGEDNCELVADLCGLHSFKAVSEEYDMPLPEAEESPAFEDLTMTTKEELGLGKSRRDPCGEDGMQASDIPEPDRMYPAGCMDGWYAPGYVPEQRTYRAELSDPECSARMKIFSAENGEDAIRQAYDFAISEVILLELLELDKDYNVKRSVDLPTRSACPSNSGYLAIEYPLTGFTPEKLNNLAKLVNAKATLIKKALGVEVIPIERTDTMLRFPWFSADASHDEIQAYTVFIKRLCLAAKLQKRVIAAEQTAENEKYAFRCFLLKLGFIGDEYKMARKILLSLLEGDSAWRAKA